MGKSIKGSVFGVDFKITECRLADMDTMECVVRITKLGERMQEGDNVESELFVATIPLAYALFGERQWDHIKRELRKADTGLPHTAACVKFVNDALAIASKKKNGELKN